MAPRVPLGERGWEWKILMGLAVFLHAILAVTSFAYTLTLLVMDARTAATYKSSGVSVLIALTTLSAVYGVLGCVTFLRRKVFWGRVLLAGSVLMIMFFFTTLFTLAYQSLLCGIEHNGTEDLVVTFNESKIENCDWDVATCVVDVPDSVAVTCPSVKHFWKHIGRAGREGVYVNTVLGATLYSIFLLVLSLLSLRLSLELGVEEVIIYPPTAGFRSSASSFSSSSYSFVPLTNII